MDDNPAPTDRSGASSDGPGEAGIHKRARLVVAVADLLGRPGARRHEVMTAPAEAMQVVSAKVAAGTPITLDLTLEWVTEGILASGSARTGWTAECRRCLGPVGGEAEAKFRELFEPRPTEGDSYLLRGDRIDMAPLAHEALTLALPLAPLCRPDCAGLCPQCGTDLNQSGCGCEGASADPRWSALDALRLDEG